MLVEPVGEVVDVPEHGEPAVFASGMNDEFHGASDFPSAGLVALGLVQRNKRVGVTVVDEGWWRLRVQMEDRGEGLADVHPVGWAAWLGAEGFDETLGRTAVAQVLGRISEVQQIGDGIEDGHRLNGAAFPVDGVRRVGRAGAATGGQKQAQVAARAAASDT